MDSVTSVSFQKNAELQIIKITNKIVYERHAGYEVTRYSLREGDAPWKTGLTDSIVFGNPETVIFRKGDSGNAVFRCAAVAGNYVCKLTETLGEKDFTSERKVWYLTGGRVDSVMSYDSLGATESKIRYFWSAPTASSLPRPRPRLSGLDRRWGIFDLTGRRFRP
jgi:hypothetical protein